MNQRSIGYWLYYTHRCVAYAFAEVLRAHCAEQEKPYVVTPPQWGMLSSLYEDNGLTIGSIGQRRGIDAPTVTGIVKRLEQVGLVERQHDREDRRVVKVYLTDEGQSITRSLSSVAREFDNVMLGDFSQDEQQALRTSLQQIIVNVSAVAMGTGDRFGLLAEDMHCSDSGDRK